MLGAVGSRFVFLCWFSRLKVMLRVALWKGLFSKGFAQKVMLFPRLDTVSRVVSAKCFLVFSFLGKNCTFCLKEAVRAAVRFLFQWGCADCSLFCFLFPSIPRAS